MVRNCTEFLTAMDGSTPASARLALIALVVGHRVGLTWGDSAGQHAAIEAGLPVCDSQGTHCLHLLSADDNTDADLDAMPLYLFDGTIHSATLGVKQHSMSKNSGED